MLNNSKNCLFLLLLVYFTNIGNLTAQSQDCDIIQEGISVLEYAVGELEKSRPVYGDFKISQIESIEEFFDYWQQISNLCGCSGELALVPIVSSNQNLNDFVLLISKELRTLKERCELCCNSDKNVQNKTNDYNNTDSSNNRPNKFDTIPDLNHTDKRPFENDKSRTREEFFNEGSIEEDENVIAKAKDILEKRQKNNNSQKTLRYKKEERRESLKKTSIEIISSSNKEIAKKTLRKLDTSKLRISKINTTNNKENVESKKWSLIDPFNIIYLLPPSFKPSRYFLVTHTRPNLREGYVTLSKSTLTEIKKGKQLSSKTIKTHKELYKYKDHFKEQAKISNPMPTVLKSIWIPLLGPITIGNAASIVDHLLTNSTEEIRNAADQIRDLILLNNELIYYVHVHGEADHQFIVFSTIIKTHDKNGSTKNLILVQNNYPIKIIN